MPRAESRVRFAYADRAQRRARSLAARTRPRNQREPHRPHRSRPLGPRRCPSALPCRHPVRRIRGRPRRGRPLEHRQPAIDHVRIGAPHLVAHHDRVRRVPHVVDRRLPGAPGAPRVLPRLRRRLRAARALPLRHARDRGGAHRAGGPGRRRLEHAARRERVAHHGGDRRRRDRHGRVLGGHPRQRHPCRAQRTRLPGRVRGRAHAHERVQVGQGVRRQARARHRRGQLGMRHRGRRGAPRGIRRPLGAPRLLLRAPLPVRPPGRHAQSGPPAARPAQAVHRHAGAARVHGRPDAIRVPEARLPHLRVPSDREHADPEPPRAGRPAGGARHRPVRRAHRALLRRHVCRLRPGGARDRLHARLPVRRPSAPRLDRGSAETLPEHLPAVVQRSLRARHDRGIRHRLAGSLRAGRAHRRLPRGRASGSGCRVPLPGAAGASGNSEASASPTSTAGTRA
ncbi:MAG: hypothetical protein K0S05_2236 [Agromyces sp.]|nr:hypothetical protein [Agromyces sp.]